MEEWAHIENDKGVIGFLELREGMGGCTKMNSASESFTRRLFP